VLLCFVVLYRILQKTVGNNDRKCTGYILGERKYKGAVLLMKLTLKEVLCVDKLSGYCRSFHYSSRKVFVRVGHDYLL
jgi:hypothetical protein